MNQEVHFNNIRSEIIQNLNRCESELKIAVAWFTDKKIIKTINELINKGVKAEIIIYDDHVNKKELFEQLYYSKAKIYLSKKLMHNKFCVIDGRTVINGSYNWTLNASTNDENIQINFNDYEFASKFIEQFDKLAINCKRIDDYFEYSLSSLENIEYEFDKFYSDWPNYSFPYFLNTTLLEPSELNKNSKISKHIYFIKNSKEEKKYLWYHYILQSKYSLNKLLKIKREKIELPQKFDFAHVLKWDINNVAQFGLQNNIVEKHKINGYNSSYNRYYIYSIDRDGNPSSDEFRFTYKLNDWLYIMHLDGQGNKPYFIRKDLKQYPIKYSVWKILANKVLLCSNYSNHKSNLGLVSFENKVVLPFKFDNYVRNINETKADKIEEIDFIEYPKLVKINSKISKPYIDYNSYTSKDHIIHSYSLSDYSIIKKSMAKGKQVDEEYFFASEEGYKYQKFYNAIIDLLSNHNITANEFDELKSKYVDENNLRYSNLSSLINDFKIKKQVEAKMKADLAPAKKEGCYVATMVYNSYDHPKVKVLRFFRDRVLQKYYFGKLFISCYYSLSPKFVEFANGKRFITGISKNTLDLIVAGIKTWHNKVYKT